jgi:hypothetical protein
MRVAALRFPGRSRPRTAPAIALGAVLATGALLPPGGVPRSHAQADFTSVLTDLTSINTGRVLARGTFGETGTASPVTGGAAQTPPMAIAGGEGNSMSVGAQGAMISIGLTDMRPDAATGASAGPIAAGATTMSITNLQARAENSGEVTAEGIFANQRIGANGRRNSIAVQAVGAGISISATSSVSSSGGGTAGSTGGAAGR